MPSTELPRRDAPRLGSVCSGVGGMDQGLEAAGFSLAWLCEKDGQCRTVLNHRFPGVPVFEDLTGLADRDGLEPVQLLAGGTPCQDLSVAGRRAGLDGERSGLFFEFIRLADRLAPDWVLWENVDGALSSSDGEDFAVCLEGFTGFRPAVPENGWRSVGVCVGPLRWCVWRVLDAQWFGVAQRRARVFVVAGTGAEPRPEVLLEPESVSGDSAPSRATGEEIARPLGAGTSGKSYRDDLDHGAFPLNGYVPPLSPALKSRDGKSPSSDGDGDGAPIVAHTLRGEGHDASEDVLAPTLRCGGREQGAGSSGDNTPIVAFPLSSDAASGRSGEALTPSLDAAGRLRLRPPSLGVGADGDPSFTLQAGQVPAVSTVIPRRLTPRECERLMGWPDDFTLVGSMKDSPRYRRIGNGVVAPVARWIGERILMSFSRPGIPNNAP